MKKFLLFVGLIAAAPLLQGAAAQNYNSLTKTHYLFNRDIDVWMKWKNESSSPAVIAKDLNNQAKRQLDQITDKYLTQLNTYLSTNYSSDPVSPEIVKTMTLDLITKLNLWQDNLKDILEAQGEGNILDGIQRSISRMQNAYDVVNAGDQFRHSSAAAYPRSRHHRVRY